MPRGPKNRFSTKSSYVPPETFSMIAPRRT